MFSVLSRDLGGFEAHAHDEATRCVENGDLEHLQLLFDEGFLTKESEFVIDGAARSGRLDIIHLLTERATTIATTEAMDDAARRRQWDVVEYLHKHRSEGCTTNAMNAAAEKGSIRYVKWFHENRTEGCTTRAMDAAAKAGVLTIVQFLHDHRTEGCTTQAMDHAAGQGRLHIVKFLHENRTEGCTTQAMDLAAQGGHLQAVKYLQTHRTEGCTVAAIKNAAKEGFLDIVRLLYVHFRGLFGPDVLYDLLLHGAFDIWMDLRDQYPDQASCAIEAVLVEAGETLELTTIQFVVQKLGRHDLAHFAMDGAAKNYFHRDAQWLRAVYAITGPGSCRLSAIENAIESVDSYHDPKKLEFLISVCSESGAREMMISQLNKIPKNRVSPADVAAVGSAESKLGDFRLVQDPYYRCKQRPIPWAIQAITRGGDRRLLHVVRDLRSSGKVTTDSELAMLSFEGARAAAVRKGDLSALKWLFENVSELPVEPTLLDEALYYHQLEIAEYLAVHYPDACREFDWDKRPYVPWLGPCGLNVELLTWIHHSSSAAVQKAVDFGSLASFAAWAGKLAVLQQLYASHPETVVKNIYDLLTRAREKEEQNADVIAFLEEIASRTHA